MKRKIVICDDDPKFARDWKESLSQSDGASSGFDVGLAFLKSTLRKGDSLRDDEYDLDEQVRALGRRQTLFRKIKDWQDVPCIFDDIAIAVIDFDLNAEGSTLWGENLAYLTRCFSNCDMIVGMNHPSLRGDVFDLRLKGHLESYCDLHIAEEQLANRGLWTDSYGLFRPWAWPDLTRFSAVLPALANEVDPCIESKTPISSHIGLDGVLSSLPKTQSSFLGPVPAKATFKSFVEKSRSSCYPKEQVAFAKALLKHEDAFVKSAARIAAARISLWLRDAVLPGQDILVDAPHLVERFPSLLNTGELENIDIWNRTARLGIGNELGLRTELTDSFVFSGARWIGRPAWLWAGISGSEEIDDVRNPGGSGAPDFVFCEDASRFFPESQCSRFTADLDSPFVSRYVARRDKQVKYVPEAKLLD